MHSVCHHQSKHSTIYTVLSNTIYSSHCSQLAPGHWRTEMHWAVNNIFMDYVSTLLDLTRESHPKNPSTQTASYINTPTLRAGVSHRLISQQSWHLNSRIMYKFTMYTITVKISKFRLDTLAFPLPFNHYKKSSLSVKHLKY